MACSVELSLSNFVLLGALIISVKKLLKLYQQWKTEKMLERWDAPSKKNLILHNLWRCRTLPNLSPYGLKLETYLKMTKIPYELDTKDGRGPKGKIPWISLNGKHVADSQLCIEFLRKEYKLDINGKFTAEQLATAHSCRIVLEDRFILGAAWYRWVENIQKIFQLAKFPPILKIIILLGKGSIKKGLELNGIGLHTPSEIYQMTSDDLRAVSVILGNKKFICGDGPCEDDCAIFGVLAQCVWGLPGSCYENLVHGELTNLKEYCERMKDCFWPDWETNMDTT